MIFLHSPHHYEIFQEISVIIQMLYFQAVIQVGKRDLKYIEYGFMIFRGQFLSGWGRVVRKQLIKIEPVAAQPELMGSVRGRIQVIGQVCLEF
jgi:hypothetical protein